MEARELEVLGKNNDEVTNGNVTNVVNTTVNTTNNFTTTIACIDYMWKNSKILLLAVGAFMLLSISMITLGTFMITKSTNTNSDNMSIVTSQITNLEKQIKSDSELIETLLSKEDDYEARIENLENKLNSRNEVRVLDNKNSDIVKVSTNQDDSTSSLYKMKMVSSRGAECKKKATNTLGDELNDVIYLYGETDVHVTYYLGGKYSKLKLKACCPDEERIVEATYPFVVYANNDTADELFSMDFGRNTAITSIDLDVSGVDFITFKVSKNGVLYDECGLILSDTILE